MHKEDTLDGVCAQPSVKTQGFVLNHTMMRVKSPTASLDFYTRIFGMRLLRRVDFEEMKFSLYFLGNVGVGEQVPEESAERLAWTFQRPGILELTHNWGTENEEAFSYHNGNTEPKGFGHICFSVPDLPSAVAWMDENNLNYVKRPDQGKIKDVAFVMDPDGYWIEVLQADLLKNLGD